MYNINKIKNNNNIFIIYCVSTKNNFTLNLIYLS